MSVAPDIAPEAPPLEGADLEAAARDALRARVGLRLTLRTPTWRQLVFGGHRLDFKLPEVPVGVLGEIDRMPPPEQETELPQNEAETMAGALLHHLQQQQPQGTAPRSVSARKQLPPPRGAVALWHRLIFLVMAGPEALRLLVAAGILTDFDVSALAEFYPEGVNRERTEAVEAAMALTAAAQRGGHDADLPSWLNDQLLTLMGEDRPTQFLGSLYGTPDKPKAGPSASAGNTKIVDQMKPNPAPDR